jgi:hypothetical protein
MNMVLDSTQEETVVAAETGSNKSQLIRDCLAQHPGASASEVAAKLAAAGTPVSLPLIYQVLRRSGEKPEKKKAAPKAERAVTKVAKPLAVTPETSESLKPSAMGGNHLYEAMLQFVEAAGGLNKAINLLTMFKK